MEIDIEIVEKFMKDPHVYKDKRLLKAIIFELIAEIRRLTDEHTRL